MRRREAKEEKKNSEEWGPPHERSLTDPRSSREEKGDTEKVARILALVDPRADFSTCA